MEAETAPEPLGDSPTGSGAPRHPLSPARVQLREQPGGHQPDAEATRKTRKAKLAVARPLAVQANGGRG